MTLKPDDNNFDKNKLYANIQQNATQNQTETIFLSFEEEQLILHHQ